VAARGARAARRARAADRSLRAAARITDTSFNTVAKLFVDAARACADYQDRTLRNLKCKRLQLDEVWSFVYAKQKNVPGAKSAPANAGDVWTWVAIDADTKLVPSWRIGDRSSETAIAFTDDLASRLASRVQITTDGHKAYLEAIEGSFGADVEMPQSDSTPLNEHYKAGAYIAVS
jgi:IS1 family transposase